MVGPKTEEISVLVAGKHRYRYSIINTVISTEGQEYVHYSSKIVRHIKSLHPCVPPVPSGINKEKLHSGKVRNR